MSPMEGLPTRRDILDWIRAEHPRVEGDQARAWAEYLVGMEWPHIRPVVAIAANTKNHPAVVLAISSAYSEDEAFKAAAATHIERS